MTCLWSSRHADKHNRRSVGTALVKLRGVPHYARNIAWTMPFSFLSFALGSLGHVIYVMCLLAISFSNQNYRIMYWWLSCLTSPWLHGEAHLLHCSWKLCARSHRAKRMIRKGYSNKVRKKLCLWKITFQTGSCQCNLCPTFCQTALALARGILISCSTGVHLNFWDVGAVKRCCAFWDLVSTWPTCVSLQRL